MFSRTTKAAQLSDSCDSSVQIQLKVHNLQIASQTPVTFSCLDNLGLILAWPMEASV